jgi:hypothetical protein
MINIAASPTKRSQRGGVFIYIILFVIILVAAIQISLRTHAIEAHGAQAEQARNCVEKNGVWKVYQEPRPNDHIYHWLCKDSATGTVFDLIVEKINKQLYNEKTAFRPKGGKWETIFRWLEGKRGGKWHNPPSGPFELIQP